MHPVRKKRLYIILSVVTAVSVAVGLMLYALNQNINLFYTPKQIADGKAPQNTNIRIGGMVMDDSLKQDDSQTNSPDIEFLVTDNLADIKVFYSGIIPDLFREGQGVVATGKLNQENVFVASEILAKHDENYMPKEVTDALKEQGEWHENQTGSEGYGADGDKKAGYDNKNSSYDSSSSY